MMQIQFPAPPSSIHELRQYQDSVAEVRLAIHKLLSKVPPQSIRYQALMDALDVLYQLTDLAQQAFQQEEPK